VSLVHTHSPIDHICLTRLPPEAVLDEVRLAVA
jgi:hypothetical protein